MVAEAGTRWDFGPRADAVRAGIDDGSVLAYLAKVTGLIWEPASRSRVEGRCQCAFRVVGARGLYRPLLIEYSPGAWEISCRNTAMGGYIHGDTGHWPSLERAWDHTRELIDISMEMPVALPASHSRLW
jgi:hypothetical protein